MERRGEEREERVERRGRAEDEDGVNKLITNEVYYTYLYKVSPLLLLLSPLLSLSSPGSSPPLSAPAVCRRPRPS